MQIPEILIGVAILVGLVGLKMGGQYWSVWRLKQWWATGNQALEAKDLKTAERAFARCVKVMPTWPTGRTMLGVVLAAQGKIDRAEEQFKFASDLEPKNPEGYLGLLLFYALHRPDHPGNAVKALEKAIALDPATPARLRNDPRLEQLRANPEIARLLDDVQEG
jgi:predicted Zn-dependent protease